MATSEPTVVDVGCGTGIWLLEMATRFPQAGYLGIDIVLPSIPRSVPSNLSFKQFDLSEGIPDEYTGRFDIVHCRMVVYHVKNPPKLVNDLVRCLKPGGLVIIHESLMDVFDEHTNPVTPFFYNPQVGVAENTVNARDLSALGGCLAFFDRLIRGSKHRPASDVLKDTRVVENIRFQEFVIPIGWAGKGIPRGEELGTVLHSNLAILYETYCGMLIAQGVPSAVVDAMKKRVITEFEERRCMMWSYVSGTAPEQSTF